MPEVSTSGHTSKTCVRLPLLCLVCFYFFESGPGFSCGHIGMKLSKAYTYLGDVKDHKRVIPFRRFSGGVGRASQAKEFKATQGMSFVAP